MPTIPALWEAEAGRFLSSRSAWSKSEFQDSQGSTEKPCLEKKPNSKKPKNKQKKKVLKNVRAEEKYLSIIKTVS